MRFMVHLGMSKKSLPTSPVSYPSGTCVDTPGGLFYIIGNKKYRIGSDRILNSWSFPRKIKTSDEAVSHLRIAGRLGFRSGSVVTNLADSRVYLIEDKTRR